jgi:hypothetical protein
MSYEEEDTCHMRRRMPSMLLSRVIFRSPMYDDVTLCMMM